MAYIDNLIDAIKDPQLRVALRSEYDKVTKNRRLGLVFDRHLPESVVLPGFAIRDGEKVQILAEGTGDPTDLDGSGVWTVTRVGPETTVLRDGNGDSREAPTARLVAAREFGDPIYPGLISTGRVVRGGGPDGDDGGKPFHTVINAENYHALEALLFAHEGQVDAIYIDPPYNTGARDWKYNNDYVDDSDPYRHSKWLSFIERRLHLAKRLLNPSDSVLIVTIDEKEYLRLGLLLEQTFPESRIQMISSIINPKGATRSNAFGRTDEYVYFVMFGSAAPHAIPLGTEWKVVRDVRAEKLRWAELLRAGTNARREDRQNLFYPVFLRQTDEGPVFESAGDAFFGDDVASVTPPDGCVTVWPIRSDGSYGNWQVNGAALRTLFEKGFARCGPWRGNRTTIAYLKKGEQAKVQSGVFPVLGNRPDGSVVVDASDYSPVFVPGTQWRITAHEAGGVGGSGLLKTLIPGRTFPFPKSLYAVEDALRFFLVNKPKALILDFFSGSGTTAHAVMRLNRQDRGHRRSISVTNNEVSEEEQTALTRRGLQAGDPEWEALGICEYVTKPRIRAAITGRTPNGDKVSGDYRPIDAYPMAEGFEENAEFFTLSYEDPTFISLGRRFEAVAPLLWLRAGAVGERIDHVAEDGWAIPPRANYGVLFDVSAWGAFVEAAARRDDLVHAFVVTDSLVEYQQIVARISPTVKTTRLYADYLRNFEVNTRV